MRTLTHDERLRRRIETAARKVGSVNQLAQAAGLPQSSLSRYLRGHAGLTWTNVVRLLDYLDRMDTWTGVANRGGFKVLNGRPKLSKLHVRVNYDERRTIEALAAQSGKSMSVWARDKLLGRELDREPEGFRRPSA
jgi:hypothetical protein